MKVLLRQPSTSQRCQIWVHNVETAENALLLETKALLLEAPNWTLQGDALILNGAGDLWRSPVGRPELQPIAIEAVPPINNDHILDPDGEHIYPSDYDDWHRAPLAGGTAVQVTGTDGPKGLMHFLHGVSPDGTQLAFVGVQAARAAGSFTVSSAEIYTISVDGTGYRQDTIGGAPADGPEYSPDGKCV